MAQVTKRDSDRNRKYGYIDKTGAVVVPLECDDAGMVEADEYSDSLYWVKKGASYGVFESPYRVSDEQESGNLIDDIINIIKPGSNKSPAGTPNSTTPASGDSGTAKGSSPVGMIAAGIAVVVVIGAAVLVLKKKKPAVETVNTPPAQPQPPRPATPPERPQAVPSAREAHPDSGPKFCPNCGKPLSPGVKFCPECGYSLQSKEG